jgi:hypothetical protein
LKKEEIYKLLSNKCAIQDDENLSIINNDFSEHELNLLSEYAHKRLYFHNGKRNNAIKNTLQAFKTVYKKAKDLKVILGINFMKLFEVDQDSNYKHLLNTNGEVVQNLDPWIVERIQKQQQTNTTFSHYATRQRSNTNSTASQSNSNNRTTTLTDIINGLDS